MPASTSSSAPRPPLMRWNSAGSSVSRLTVTRSSPASRSAAACRAEQHAVGGHRQVGDAGDAAQPRHQLGQLRPQQRLATGQAQLAHAQLGGQPAQPLDLVEAEPLVVAQEGEMLAVGRLRHAVRAAEIAAIHHRDAQVVQRPAALVQRRRRRAANLGNGVRIGHVTSDEERLRCRQAQHAPTAPVRPRRRCAAARKNRPTCATAPASPRRGRRRHDAPARVQSRSSRDACTASAASTTRSGGARRQPIARSSAGSM